MDSNNPIMMTQMLVFTEMGEKSLDYQASCEAWKATASPIEYLSWRRVTPLRTANKAILSTDDFVTVTPSDLRGEFYTFTEDDGGNETTSFGDTDVKMEYEARHPGTSQESDVENGVDAFDKYPYYRINERTSPITTTASRLLFSVVMDAPGEGKPLEMKAAYRHQLSVRIDEARQCLNLDCYEYKPTCLDMKNEDKPPLPTNRSMEKFDNTFNPQMKMDSAWDPSDSEDDENDENNEWLDKIVEPKKGTSFPLKAIVKMNHQAAIGNFVNSRSLRLRLPLSDLTGIRLMKHNDEDTTEEESIGAVLILEIREPRGEHAFASRMVRGKYHCENDFVTIPDWTPDEMASKATRFYFYGSLPELKQTAALIAKICPRAAAMLASGSEESNALRASVQVEYGTAPSLAPDEKNGGKSNDEKMPARKKPRNMTEEDVHKALVDANIVDSLSAAEDANPCLKRAILLGHIEILPSTTADTIVYEGECTDCSETIPCTVRDAINQSTYGGNDCGEGAEIVCPGCRTGNHITRICMGNASYDSGKFHNHCTDCPDFGQCIGDYREAHCHHCGQHYFQGSSGFPCPNCGGGKSKKVSDLAPPPQSAWDGKIPNIEEVWDAILAREPNAGKRAMMKAMMLGPEANYDGNEVVGLMSALVGAMGGDGPAGSGGGLAGMMASSNQSGSSRPGEDGDQCRLM